MSNRLLVAVCGVGDPNLDKKIVGITNNLNMIKKTAPVSYINNIDFIFYCYDDSLQDQLSSYKNCKIVHEPGYVGEFIYRHLQPEMVSNYDRIIVMLDDIVMQPNFNIAKIMKIQDDYDFDIISPSLTQDSEFSHRFMLSRIVDSRDYVMVTRFVEFFMYIMKPSRDSYAKWLSCFDQHTKYMWGIDTILNLEHKLKLGMMNSMTIKHMFKGNLCDWRCGDGERKRVFDKVVAKHQKNKTKTVVTRSTKNNDLHAFEVIDKIYLTDRYI